MTQPLGGDRSRTPPQGDQRCTATAKSTGTRCAQWAVKGTPVCRYHGGKSPGALAARDRRSAKAEARRKLDIPDHVDPRDQLTKELARTVAWVRWLGQQVNATDDVDLIWSRTKHTTSADGPTVTSESKPSIWWAQYVAERKHLVEVAKTAHACGVEDRRIEIELGAAQAMLQIILGVVADLGHDAESPAVKQVVTDWVRRTHAIETGISE